MVLLVKQVHLQKDVGAGIAVRRELQGLEGGMLTGCQGECKEGQQQDDLAKHSE